MPQTAIWSGTPSIKGSSETVRMALLTTSLIGLQFTWGIEMSYCTPYLLQLGLTKSRVSLVWIAGPLSGLVMQPIVGILADRSKNRWGRRRPFMVGGTIVVALCLIVLGWTKEIVGVFLPEGDLKRDVTVSLAVLTIYAIDFAINAVQASCRSLVVDTLPISKQQLGSAWASRMISVGSLLVYGAGSIDLERVLGKTLGDTQFKQLCVIAALALALAVAITSYAVTERVLISNGEKDEDGLGVIQMLSQILQTTRHLPNRIAAICFVQFWAFIGWFPFMFYSATWVGEIFLRYDSPPNVKHSEDTLGEMGRVGSMSLICFSIFTFLGSFLLPLAVRPPQDEQNFTPRPPPGIAGRALLELEKRRPTLLTTWVAAHLMFACSMILAPFIRSVRAATVIIAICGIPGTVNSWAPYTFMGVEINRLESSSQVSGHSYRRLSASPIDLEKPDEDNIAAGELSGIYLGILNLFQTIPQFLGTFISWIVFSILEPGKSPELAKDAHPDEHHPTDGPNAISVCLFIGAIAAFMAAYAANRLRYIF